MAATNTKRKTSKAIGAEAAHTGGTLHVLPAAAPAAIVADVTPPSAAAALPGGSVTVSAKGKLAGSCRSISPSSSGTSAITICCVPGMRPMPAWARISSIAQAELNEP